MISNLEPPGCEHRREGVALVVILVRDPIRLHVTMLQMGREEYSAARIEDHLDQMDFSRGQRGHVIDSVNEKHALLSRYVSRGQDKPNGSSLTLSPAAPTG